ncbi:hypothetical protein K402DRAFT_349458 [Aulographum hederae CBS 113979]|uniref:FAR-17a/AIG1-like protein n=1 Tax=Aulographum hederae CBS 113979 TaxID=1176131 RepID=A0A6G1H9C5_9PEZI|nr:hypothetical protein K402DRAFT_349458 [Aulographum hederae CBS 113979]
MPCFKRRDVPFDPTHRFSTSWLLPLPLLFLYRALVSLYCFTTTFFLLAHDCVHDDCKESDQYNSFFTHLTFWGIAFYSLFAAVHTGSCWLWGRPLLSGWPRWLQELHGVLYSTVVVFPWLVTIVFWTLLFSGTFTSSLNAWTNITQHGLNAVFAFLEIVHPRTAAPPIWHLLPLITLLGLYLALAFITVATQHFYVYDFLDYRVSGARAVAGYCFGILGGVIVVFGVVHGLVKLRVWVTEGLLGMEGKFGGRRRDRERDEEEEILKLREWKREPVKETVQMPKMMEPQLAFLTMQRE